jgi:dehydrogenase/reductase SDR family protein 7B
MQNDFNGKVVWITGASSGIGEALAYALSGRGAKLILSSRRADELERVRLACAHPDAVRVIPLDLLDHALFGAKTAEAIAAFDRIDLLVHNGGIAQHGLVMETPMDVQRKVMEVDYFSYVALTQAVLPHFVERNSGRFIVMSSVMGKIGTPMRSAYAAAKHALHGYFDCLRSEVAPLGIGVTLLTPGYIRTNIALYAVTKDGSPLGKSSENIEKGLAADRAARQILRAVGKGKYEAYIGKMAPERIALWLNRWAPGILIKMAPRLLPK